MANAFGFLLTFACGFLFLGKRPVLAVSTRVALLAFLASALWYATSSGRAYQTWIGVEAVVANVVFIAFVGVDFWNWRQRQVD